MNIKTGSFVVLLAFPGLGCSDHSTVEETEGTGGNLTNASGGGDHTAAGGGGGEAPASAGGAGGSNSACNSDDDMTPSCRAERRNACAPLEEVDCEADRFCSVLSAQEVDDENECKAERSQVVGCGLIGCSSTYTLATDLAGTTWVFPSDCVPLEWTAVSLSNPNTCID